MARVVALINNRAGHRHYSRLADSTVQAADDARIGVLNGYAQLVSNNNGHRFDFCFGIGRLVVARFAQLVAESFAIVNSTSRASCHVVCAAESF